MEYAQLSTSSFADKINISRSSLTHIFSGRNQPSLDIAKKILSAFPEISTEWLIMGMGNMFQEVEASPVVQVAPDVSPQAHQQTELFADEVYGPVPEAVSPVETAISASKTVFSDQGVSVVTGEPASEPKHEMVAETPVGRPSGTSARGRGRGRASESYNPTRETKRERISYSQGDKKIVQILFIYEDKSFDIYTPNNG